MFNSNSVQLFVWLANENSRTATEILVDKKPTIHYLKSKKGNVYALRVAGYSGGGTGKKSPTVFFTLGKLQQYYTYIVNKCIFYDR